MKKTPQVFTQGRSVQNFSQIERFLKSPACPKVFGQTDIQTDRQTLSDSSSTEVENTEMKKILRDKNVRGMI